MYWRKSPGEEKVPPFNPGGIEGEGNRLVNLLTVYGGGTGEKNRRNADQEMLATKGSLHGFMRKRRGALWKSA